MAMEKSGILVGVIKVSKELSKDKLGVKRICGSCGAKFYDLGKTPIICPKCGTPYEEITSPKPSAPVAPVKEAPEVEEVALRRQAAEADDVEVIADDDTTVLEDPIEDDLSEDDDVELDELKEFDEFEEDFDDDEIDDDGDVALIDDNEE